MTNISESQLLEHLKNQTPDITRQFIEKNYKSLKKSLHFARVSQDEYDDIIQESFSTFFQSLERFQGKSKLSTFLYGIFFNKLREARRKYLKTPQPVADIFDKQQFDETGHWLSSITIHDPEAMENYSELSSTIESCLEKMPFIYQQVIMLQASSTMSKEEICHSLEISDTNYRQYLSRGRKSLRSCISEVFDENDELQRSSRNSCNW